jgi:hypothetical protein
MAGRPVVSANLHELALPMLLPTNTINTTVSDFRPIKQMQMVKFDGQKWELFWRSDERGEMNQKSC